jgi:hypothetical protein
VAFCPQCGSEVSDNSPFCPKCGKQLNEPQQPTRTVVPSRPTGITILGVLHLIIGIILLIAAVMIGAISGSMMGYSMMGGIFGAIGGFIAAVIGILAIIYLIIAWALFNGKSWARKIIIILTIIDLVTGTITLAIGNVFEITSIILDIIVLYYMWRPHVIAYFNK